MLRNTWVLIAIIVVLGLGSVFALGNVINSKTNEVKTYKEAHEARFELVEEFIFRYDTQNLPIKGQIYKDKTTNIEYLYIWVGTDTGGPSITRYYRKE